MPSRSMSFIVKTWTPDARICAFSFSSRLRMPTSTVCCRQHRRRLDPIAASSAGSLPSSAASGMPCTLPLVVVSGVFMSPCASTQIRPSGCDVSPANPRRRWRRPTRPRGCDRRRARAAARPPRATSARRRRARGRHWRSRRCTSSARRPAAAFRESAPGGRPCRRPTQPSAAMRSPMPAIRSADGPMSTPRRPPPRSSGTPMMWTGFIEHSIAVGFHRVL